MIRPSAVAGQFYPDDPGQLRETLHRFLTPESKNKVHAQACLVPHAGYGYSGSVAGEVYRGMEIPPRVILIGPRHFPGGAPMAILSDGFWQTPLGLATVDTELAAKMTRACPFLQEDDVAHRAEHSLEVQLPFLQWLSSSFAFVPIVLGTVQYEKLEALGAALAEIIHSEPEQVLLIASSDMNHYESDEITRVKDRKAIDRILALDPRGLFDTVRDAGISMCGYGATVAMLVAMRGLNATHADLVCYATSGDVNGDLQQVVGYAGIVIT